jgi:membrane protease YdiL (CAAX protease family)
MNQSDPYQVTPASAEVQQPILRRPVCVTIALVILWILLACTALGSIAQLSKPLNSGEQESMLYVAYLAFMVFVPALLLELIP